MKDHKHAAHELIKLEWSQEEKKYPLDIHDEQLFYRLLDCPELGDMKDMKDIYTFSIDVKKQRVKVVYSKLAK